MSNGLGFEGWIDRLAKAAPFKGRAIVLDQLLPVVVAEVCTGCGLCTHACPVTVEEGARAINIEPPAAGGTSS